MGSALKYWIDKSDAWACRHRDNVRAAALQYQSKPVVHWME